VGARRRAARRARWRGQRGWRVDEIGSAAAAVLAAVFGVAGAAKAARPRATARAFAGLGVPLPGLLARVAPVAELVLAAALVVRPRLGGAAALVALIAFSAVLAAALGRGEPVSCGCFGAAGSAPVTAADLVRNALLGVLAAAALTVPGPAGVPGLAGAVAATAAVVAGLVTIALVRLRAAAGPLLAVPETGP